MATVKCKCGNPYFARVNVNRFKDFPASLHSPMQEVDPDYDIRIYQCISCNKYMLPPINYYNTTDDIKEEYHIISKALEGEVVEPKARHKPKPVHSGTAVFVGGDKDEGDPSTHGKFVPVQQ